ncbi:MAG: winged helix-turn-helix domain-containing protein, partial [Pyrinomonadaceae bacterium]
MSKRRKHSYEFGRFRIDAVNRLLFRDAEPVALQPKTFDTLLLFVEHRGEVLGKEELIRRLWPDSFVEESNLTQNVYVLRKVLG